MIKHDSDRKAIMERITDRKSKLKIPDSNILQTTSSILVYDENNLIDDNVINLNLLFDDLVFEINSSVPNILDLEKLIFM